MLMLDKLSSIVKQLIIGLEMGSIYALVAVGYTMVYGIIKLINFAHGDFIMVATFMLYTFITLIGVPVIVAILISFILAIALGVLTERLAYRPLRKSPSITALITAIAVSLLLQNVFETIYGSERIPIKDLIPSKDFQLGSIAINNVSIITIVMAIVAMVALTLFIKKTKAGTAMRAVSQNADAAKLMGIDIDKTISLTFAIGSLLAGLAALMYYMKFTNIDPYLGSNLGLFAFIAAVVGGIGSIPGAFIGGFLIGFVEILPSVLGIDNVFKDIFLFGLLIIVLLFKPQGLLGKNVGEKV